MTWREGIARGSAACAVALVVLNAPGVARVQHEHMHMPARADTARVPGHAMTGHAHAMPGMYRPYAVTREASGTAWQPESAPHEGVHLMRGEWSFMLHGFAWVIADRQGGPRGDDRFFSSNMLMGMASRPLGAGRLGLRGMASLEPGTIGRHGYPELLQTGETADGITSLVDRQHPHDLFMELAASYSVSDARRSAFLYVGLPGEPALGPPVFMHRASGEADPESPIAHHWLDSTHITYGVVTGGVVRDGVKIEASAFRGREPDQNRWDIETPKLDSYSGRLSWNPTPDWAIQASGGRLHHPEQLDPYVMTDRVTVSVMHVRRLGRSELSALAAWGENRNRPEPGTSFLTGVPSRYHRDLDAFLLEGSLTLAERHMIFARAERVEKDELFPGTDPRASEVFTVSRISAGYRREVLEGEHWVAGVGAMGGLALVPESLKGVYGDTPLFGSLFLRAGLR